MSRTSEFVADPPGFLSKYVVISDSTSATGPISATPRKFYIKEEKKNVCTLRFASGTATDVILAYWLPWKTSELTSIELDNGADFFFTSEMSNCRFSILTDGVKPRVAHVAGNVTRGKRDQLEKAATDTKAARRLSIAGGDIHGYRGRDSTDATRQSSAFVFGRRQSDNTWKFYAQIATGFLDGTMLAKPLQDDIAIINACLEI